MRVCCGDRRTCCSLRGRRAAPRQLSGDPPERDGSPGQTHVEPVPRPREDSDQGPRRLGPDGRHRRRPRDAHRRRRRHVHLRGPGRGHAALRAGAAGGAAAQDDHPRRGGHRTRHRVDVVPQRPAARVGARDGHPHRHRRSAHRLARRSTPTSFAPSPIPMARLAIRCASRSSWSRSNRSSRLAICGSTRSRTSSPRWTASSKPAATTATRWITSTVWCSRPTKAT